MGKLEEVRQVRKVKIQKQKSKRRGKISDKKDQAGSGKKENSSIGEKLKREKLRQCFKHISDNMSSNISNNISKKYLGEEEHQDNKSEANVSNIWLLSAANWMQFSK